MSKNDTYKVEGGKSKYNNVIDPTDESERHGQSIREYIDSLLPDRLFEAMIKHGKPVTAEWIAKNVPGIKTSQKAIAVTKAAFQAGKPIERFYQARQAFYRIADQ